jgi:type I restriction enzyme, S subunit
MKMKNLPKGWEIKKLGELCQFTQGIQIDVNKQKKEKFKDSVRFLRIIDFTQQDEPPRFINHPGDKYYLKKNEIAMVRYGTVGFVCTNKEGVIANNLFKIIPNEKVDPKYLINFFKSLLFLSKLETKGATMQALSFGLIKPIQIPFPPLETQQRIVTKIEELFSELDKGVEELKKSQEQLKTYRQSVLKWAFEISKGHSVFKKLYEITSKIGSGSTPKGGGESYHDSGIPLIRSLNIHFNYIKFEGLAYLNEEQANKLKNVIVNEGDVLLNITGASIGRVNIAPKEFHNGRVNQHVSIIRAKDNVFTSKYLKYFLQTSRMQNWITNANYGVTRQALTKGMLENLEIPLPPIEEQHQIVQEIEIRLSVADKLEEQIKTSLQQAEALRQSILKKAFSGELVR